MPDDEPTQRLAEGRRLLDAGDFDAATRILAPLTGHPDPSLAADAWLAIGIARYRSDDEPGALVAWQQAAHTDSPSAWLGWRSVAEQLVRDGDLEGAIGAYREADRRAPAPERGAIANRIAWLLKETGHDFAARRQFNRARGAYATHVPYVTYAIIAICAALFVMDGILTSGASLRLTFVFGGPPGPLEQQLEVNAVFVMVGEWWRIITSAFVHRGIVHIGFNMYVLYLYGAIVERLYGRVEYLAIYVLSAAGGSVLTILLEPGQFVAGASGAIFGIVGLLFVVSRRHHAVLGREARMIVGGIGGYLVFLLIFTFVFPGISWTGHLGGLLVGAVLGFFLAPTGVATMSGMWRAPSGEALTPGAPRLLRAVVYVGVTVLLVAGSVLAMQLVSTGPLLT